MSALLLGSMFNTNWNWTGREHILYVTEQGESEDEREVGPPSSVSHVKCSLGIPHPNFGGTRNVSNFEVF